MYEEATDKKIFAKLLRAELEDIGYTVKTLHGNAFLKNWKMKKKIRGDNSTEKDEAERVVI